MFLILKYGHTSKYISSTGYCDYYLLLDHLALVNYLEICRDFIFADHTTVYVMVIFTINKRVMSPSLRQFCSFELRFEPKITK